MRNESEALQWIVNVLNKNDIPFLICGGLAAIAYGAKRTLNDIDLFVPENRFQDVVRFGKEYLSKPARHYCEASEGWDLTYVQFTFQEVKIEVGNAEAVKIFNSREGEWTPLAIDFSRYQLGTVFGIPILLMNRKDLIDYKRKLGARSTSPIFRRSRRSEWMKNETNRLHNILANVFRIEKRLVSRLYSNDGASPEAYANKRKFQEGSIMKDELRSITPNEIIQRVTENLADIVPRNSWGEISLFYNPGNKLPHGVYFCTIKDKDGDNDRASNLSRDGVFRLNIGVPKETYLRLFGEKPKRPAKGQFVNTGHDFTERNVLMPHPIYSWMSWVCILSPTVERFEEIFPLIIEAHSHAVLKCNKKGRAKQKTQIEQREKN